MASEDGLEDNYWFSWLVSRVRLFSFFLGSKL